MWRNWSKRGRLKISYLRNAVGSNPTLPTKLSLLTNPKTIPICEAKGEFVMNNEIALYEMACNAASEAWKACRPIPMIVGQAKGLFGNEIVPGTEEFVADGVCGFAWVRIKPARGPFVKFLKTNNIGRKDVYAGGWSISSSGTLNFPDYTQSMQRKEAACNAFVRVLRDNGVNAWMESRMD